MVRPGDRAARGRGIRCRDRRPGKGPSRSIRTGMSRSARWAEALNRTGRLDRQRSLLEDAVARMPLGGVLRGGLADVLWQTGDRPAALDALEQAGRNLPDYDWAWNALEERVGGRWAALSGPERGRPAISSTRRPGRTAAQLAPAGANSALVRIVGRADGGARPRDPANSAGRRMHTCYEPRHSG